MTDDDDKVLEFPESAWFTESVLIFWIKKNRSLEKVMPIPTPSEFNLSIWEGSVLVDHTLSSIETHLETLMLLSKN